MEKTVKMRIHCRSRICVLYDGKQEKEKVHEMFIFLFFCWLFFIMSTSKKKRMWVSVRIGLDSWIKLHTSVYKFVPSEIVLCYLIPVFFSPNKILYPENDYLVLGFKKLGFLGASRPSSISIITLLFAQLAKQKQQNKFVDIQNFQKSNFVRCYFLKIRSSLSLPWGHVRFNKKIVARLKGTNRKSRFVNCSQF